MFVQKYGVLIQLVIEKNNYWESFYVTLSENAFCYPDFVVLFEIEKAWNCNDIIQHNQIIIAIFC